MALRKDEMELVTKYFEMFGQEQRPMAASEQVINYTIGLASSHEVDSMLDAGSGLSSLIFHNTMKCPVYSVDDDPIWALRTMNAISSLLHKEVRVTEWASGFFDLVFYDYGNIEQRIFSFRKAMDMCTRFMVIDDMHVTYYREYVQEVTQGMELRFLPQTLDEFGRYSALLVK